MASAWGDSWGSSWGDSWGAVAVLPSPLVHDRVRFAVLQADAAAFTVLVPDRLDLGYTQADTIEFVE